MTHIDAPLSVADHRRPIEHASDPVRASIGYE